jgi:thiamine kinase-like enzyme
MATDVTSILSRVAPWHGRADLVTSPLHGGITNENVRVDVGGAEAGGDPAQRHSFVLRLGGANTHLLGIDRQHEWVAARAAAAAGLAPEAVYFIEPEGFIISRFITGRPISPDEMRQPEMIRQLAGMLQRVHALPPIPGSFSPFRVVEDYRRLANERGVAGWPADFDQLLARTYSIEAAFKREAAFPCPCHNDLLNENFLRETATGRIFLLDWEYAGMGDSYFDLANLSAHHHFGDEQDSLWLQAYFGEATPRRLARLKLMKCMSNFREAMWGMLQLGLSSLDFDFRGYATDFFGRLRAGLGDPRVDGWLATLNSA